MFILIDYDNIPRELRRWGVEHVVRRIASSFAHLVDGQDNSLRFRLYGGWFEASTLTKPAQDIQDEVDELSTFPILRQDGTRLGLARVQLALSMLIDPTVAITHTFRRKGPPTGLQCTTRPWLTCAAEASCPLFAVVDFVAKDICPSETCALGPSDVFYRQEQKMVDTMLVVDVMQGIREEANALAVVSSDDDVWPGIHSAIHSGGKILHVRTRATTSPLNLYKRLPTDSYRAIELT